MVSPGEVAGKVVFCLCGPKGSLCCFILSVWGTLMLVRLSWLANLPFWPGGRYCGGMVWCYYVLCIIHATIREFRILRPLCLKVRGVARKIAVEPLIKATPNVRTPLIKATPNVRTPLIKATPNVRTPLIKATPNVKTPLIKATPNVRTPLIKATPNVRTPLYKGHP